MEEITTTPTFDLFCKIIKVLSGDLTYFLGLFLIYHFFGFLAAIVPKNSTDIEPPPVEPDDPDLPDNTDNALNAILSFLAIGTVGLIAVGLYVSKKR